MTSPRLHILTREEEAAFEVAGMDARLDRTNEFLPTRERPVPGWLERGVHVAPWLDASGNPIVVAVQTNHRLLTWQPWLPGQTYEQVASGLQDLLDDTD